MKRVIFKIWLASCSTSISRVPRSKIQKSVSIFILPNTLHSPAEWSSESIRQLIKKARTEPDKCWCRPNELLFTLCLCYYFCNVSFCLPFSVCFYAYIVKSSLENKYKGRKGNNKTLASPAMTRFHYENIWSAADLKKNGSQTSVNSPNTVTFYYNSSIVQRTLSCRFFFTRS